MAACTVAVPDAVRTTSDAASTSSVCPSTTATGGSPASPSGAKSSAFRCGARASTNCTPGRRAAIERGGTHEIGKDRADFIRPAAGQQGHRRRLRFEPAGGEEGLARQPRPREVDQRVAHELHRHARAPVEFLLEGEDHEHPIDDAGEGPEAARAPCPDLRADVVDDGHASALHRRGDADVEIREVDGHEGIRRAHVGLVQQSSVHPPRSREDPDSLNEAGHGQSLEVPDELGTRRAQVTAPEPATRVSGSSRRSSRTSSPA